MKKVFLIITVVLLIAVIAGMGVKISFMSTDYDKLEKELKAEKKNDTTEEGQEERNCDLCRVDDLRELQAAHREEHSF